MNILREWSHKTFGDVKLWNDQWSHSNSFLNEVKQCTCDLSPSPESSSGHKDGRRVSSSSRCKNKIDVSVCTVGIRKWSQVITAGPQLSIMRFRPFLSSFVFMNQRKINTFGQVLWTILQPATRGPHVLVFLMSSVCKNTQLVLKFTAKKGAELNNWDDNN